MIKTKIDTRFIGIHARRAPSLINFLIVMSFILGLMLITTGLKDLGFYLFSASVIGYFFAAKDKEAALYGLLFMLGLAGFWLSVAGHLLGIPALTGG